MTHLPTIEITFEELPLIVDGGFRAGLIDGKAEIEYRAIEWKAA